MIFWSSFVNCSVLSITTTFNYNYYEVCTIDEHVFHIWCLLLLLFILILIIIVIIIISFNYLQANVYHATKSDGQELAVKVYKTSVLVFKYDSFMCIVFFCKTKLLLSCIYLIALVL